MNEQLLYAVLLSALAGLATTLGSLLGIFVRKPGPTFMAFTLGFAAGVMVHVSYVELLQTAVTDIGFGWAHVAFFGGMGVMFVIDLLIPHEWGAEHYEGPGDGTRRVAMRTGLLVALGIAIHNFPEGLVTFTGAMKNLDLGIALAVAVGIHNIPEGLAVSVPIYAATGSRKKAFWWSFLSGISEPVGALMGALILAPFLSKTLLGVFLGGVGGIMVFISLDELVPAAREYEKEHVAIAGVLLGMVVMAISLWALRISGAGG
ncbi:MAG: zinc transporter ZupT [bacterium]